MPLKIFSSTHQGARNYQEDRHGHWSGDLSGVPTHFAVVIDGAGGHGGGAEAAEAALRAAETAWKSKRTGSPKDFLSAWMETAHDAVNEAGKAIQRSARAVAVACLTDGRHAHWVHAGDSRLMHFREGVLLSRTRDDSVVQVLFEQGEIREEEMGKHPDQGRLLQSLGGDDPPKPRLGHATLEPGDALLLCSDGFWEHLSNDELESLVQTPLRRMQAALEVAIDTAVQRAGPKADNTTATVVIGADGMSSSIMPSWKILAAAVALTVAAVLTFHFSRNPQDESISPPENAKPIPAPTQASEPAVPTPGIHSMTDDPLLPEADRPPSAPLPVPAPTPAPTPGDPEIPSLNDTPES